MTDHKIDYTSKYFKNANSKEISLEQVFYKKYLLYDLDKNLNPSLDIYKSKYLKYKNKYLNLKNQIAGTPNAKFKYSINRPETPGEYFSGEMLDKIQEFETGTNEPFKSSSIRKVNLVEMGQNIHIIDFFRKSKVNRKLLNDQINDLIMKDDWYKYFLFVTRFYNETSTYKKPDFSEGVKVPANKVKEVFTDEFIKNPQFTSNLDDNSNWVGTHRKGFGNDNLYCTLNEIKKYKPDLQVLYLHANGDENLVKYYENIGFSILIENQIPHVNESGKAISLYEYIMFGMFEEIMKKLSWKNQSDCTKV